MSFLKGYIKDSYRGIVITFTAVSLVLIGTIVYFSFSKTVIMLTPALKNVQQEFTVKVGEKKSEEDDQDMISGRIIKKEKEGEKTFDSLGEKKEIPGKASGKVRVVNNYSKTQPLVAGTRLLSDGEVLFRTQKSVSVPPGSSVEVPVQADEEGTKGDIPASHFTIVALWPGLQNQIYGESSEAMTGGVKETSVLTASTWAEAEATITDTLSDEALKEMKYELEREKSLLTLLPDIEKRDILSSDSDTAIGEETDSFHIRAKVQVYGVAADQEKLWTNLGNHLKVKLEPSEQFVRLDTGKSRFEIVDIDDRSGVTTLRVNVSGLVTLRLSSPLLDRSHFTNKDKQDITAYLLDSEYIRRVDVRFSPFWTFRAPALEDHIEVRIDYDALAS